MAVPRKPSQRKSASTPAPELESVRQPPDPPADDEEPVPSLKSGEEAEEDEEEEKDDWEGEPGSPSAQSESPSPADRREVDELTDRIFASVLSRYGWEQHGDRIEHVGEDRRRR